MDLPRYYLLQSGETYQVMDAVTGTPIATHPDKASAFLALALLLDDEEDEDENEGENELDAYAVGPGEARGGRLSLCVRAGQPGDTLPTIVGYAAVFDQPTKVRDKHNGEELTYVESFAPGAFAESLADRSVDPVALAHHDPAQVLGRVSAGTLRLREDARGLAVEIDPPNTTAGRDMVASIARGDVRGMSVGFLPRSKGLEWSPDFTRCVVRRATAAEVSCVTWPAYGGTSIALKSRARAIARSASLARAVRARRALRALQSGRLVDAVS